LPRVGHCRSFCRYCLNTQGIICSFTTHRQYDPARQRSGCAQNSS
jgi:hypothetical protein